MEDLQSVANYSSFCSSSSLLGWEYHHNLGVYNADMSHSTVPDSNYTPPYLSCLDNSDYSTGYLQDALFEFSSKRRRLLLFSDDQSNYSTCPIQSFWKENFNAIYPEDFGYVNQSSERDEVSGKMMSKYNAEVEILVEQAGPGFEGNNNTGHSSSSANSKDSLQTGSSSETLDSLSPLSAGGGEEKKRKKVVIMTRVVYPFDVVKPGGIEGDMTLNDINERILMPPTRPVMHPVGDFACKPIVSPRGPGLSGKPVVAFTRVQTQGRGTITIIRTKG
ncbi:uncharacterized protein LOC141692666 [Apium graveolens]|uniref:uncharacterized protein LOC141692666 n=1 Tax=Apium graveolens TaxID=4045 RepID=UPI003D79E5E8